MIITGTYSDEVRQSRLDAAIDRGFDPHDPDVDVPGPPLTPEWQAALDASVAEARALIAARAVA